MSDEERSILYSLVDREKEVVREEILSDSPAILDKKRELFSRARNNDVYILEKGSIEAYYPNTIDGPDKPSRAQNFCSTVVTA